jgi:phosphatidylinositol alpha-1,6-mannosyltransferase
MKICIVCFEFNKKNIRLQPWKYLYQLAINFQRRGIDVTVITNEDEELLEDIKILTVKKLFSWRGEDTNILKIYEREKPDFVIVLTGLTSVLNFGLRRKNQHDIPTIGILTSPLYSLREISQAGISEFIFHFPILLPHIVGAIMPRIFIRNWAKKFDHLVVLSQESKKRLENILTSPEIVAIPPGIEIPSVDALEQNIADAEKEFVASTDFHTILYYTSPLTLRGTDTLVKAFAQLKKTRKDCRLIFLSRIDDENDIREENYLKKLSRKKGIDNDVIFVSRYLSKNEIKQYLMDADTICLPFKLIISEVPISILEVMELGKPLVTTNVYGIKEIIGDRGYLVEPNNPAMLAQAIDKSLNNDTQLQEAGQRSRDYMKTYSRWDDVVHSFVELFFKNRY